MTEVRFYHLTRRRLEEALPTLLDRCRERGWRAVVVAGSEERVEALTQHLWSYPDRSFLPHGNARDGEPAYQPIWLTAVDENPNQATVLFLTDGAASARVADYALVCELFDGNDGAAIAAAREHWRGYRDHGHTLTYWQETAAGRWEEKQRAAPTAAGAAAPGEG